MYYDDSFVNIGRMMEEMVNPPYLKQLKTISNPPWLKDMQLISQTMKSSYSGVVIPEGAFFNALKTASIKVPTIDTKGLTKALQPLYGSASLFNSVDISSVTASMSEALTALSSAAAVIAESQTAINKLSIGLSKSIPKLFADCDFETVFRKAALQSVIYNDDSTESQIQDSFNWDEIQFRDNEIEYQGVVVTKDDVSDFMNTDTPLDHCNDEQKKKQSIIKAIISIIITIMALFDIPGNWTIQEIAQLAYEYEDSQTQQYCVYEDFANVYLCPDTTSEKIDRISYGTIINAVDEKEFWIKVTISSSKDGTKLDGWVQKTKINKYHAEKD